MFNTFSEEEFLQEALRKRIEWDKERLKQLVESIKRQEAKLKELGETS